MALEPVVRRGPRRRTWVTLAATATAYGVAILLLALGGARPNPRPWLALPDATYFYWEAAFIPFVIVLASVLAGALLHLGSLASGGTGNFEETLDHVVYATARATWTTLLPDLAIGVALVFGVMSSETWMRISTHLGWPLALIWGYLLVYVAAFVTLYARAARDAHGLTRARAVVVGGSVFAVYQFVLFIFIR